MFLETLALALVLLLSWIYVRRRRRGQKEAGNKPIPGPRGLPFLGPTSLMNVTKPHLAFYELANKYGRIFRFTFFGHKVVVLNEAALIRKAFIGEEYGNVFLKRPKTFVSKYILMDGTDLAFAEDYGKQTVLLRKMMHKCLQKMSETQTSFETHTTMEINSLLDMIESNHGKDFEMTSLVRAFLGNMMYILLYGKLPQGNDSDLIWEFSDNVVSLFETTMNLFLSTFPLARFLPGLPGDLFRLTSKARDQIFERLSICSTNETGLFEMLVGFQKETNLKYGSDVISDGNVKSIVLDVVAAGTSSSVTFLTGGILVLLHNRQCMKKIQAEIDRVIGRQRKPKLADKAEMDYTMACLYELLRYMSIGTLGLPHRIAEDTMFEGHRLSKDTLVYGNIWFVNHDPALWPDPWTFDPQRFLDTNGRLQPANAACRRNMMPFSVGKRSCPGGDFAIGRMFLYITTILQAFDLHAPNDSELLDPDPRSYETGAFVHPSNYMCRAVPRRVTTKA